MATTTDPIAQYEKKLNQLFELAQDNQHAVEDAIACFSAEREAFVKERLALLKTVASSAEISDSLHRAMADAIPAVEKAAHKAIQQSMERVLGVTTDAASQALGNATSPVIERFGTLLQTAIDVESRIKKAGYRYAWQWTALASLGIAATVAVAVVGVQQIQTQQAELQRQQAELLAQKQAFSQELARMQATVTFLEKKGGRIQLEKCGPEQRTCIEVASDQGNGRYKYRGPWTGAAGAAGTNSERSYVIPKGY